MEAALNAAGASLHKSAEWHKIVWRKTYRNVRRLQARIVKATQEGKTRKVRALQIILTRSLGGKALAVRRVTENKGKRTPEKSGTPRRKKQKVSDP